ncbi:hypothetical protein DAKH74_028310 [Maudiozyma humilis]|uniref:Uncharacterized protein n=1 Tax=Maudiozyma humilis TaxID=51915 RepID=A0AAV5RX83_MAUHU|nr:hypothetical protein DAKH74_028310 [Kazachstania humilis]
MSCEQIEDFEKACVAMQNAFRDGAAYQYLACKLQGKPLTVAHEGPAAIDALTRNFLTHYRDHGAEIVHAGDYSTVAIWTLPGKSVPMERTSDERFNATFFDESAAVKQRVIPQGMDYYYLFMIGRDPQSTAKGSTRAVFDKYTRLADAEGRALVLEAITESARDVYAYFGFVNYNTFRYGMGEVDAAGRIDPEGEGHTGYLMVYLPGAREKLSSAA